MFIRRSPRRDSVLRTVDLRCDLPDESNWQVLNFFDFATEKLVSIPSPRNLQWSPNFFG